MFLRYLEQTSVLISEVLPMAIEYCVVPVTMNTILIHETFIW
jgi:hypothetical protein